MAIEKHLVSAFAGMQRTRAAALASLLAIFQIEIRFPFGLVPSALVNLYAHFLEVKFHYRQFTEPPRVQPTGRFLDQQFLECLPQFIGLVLRYFLKLSVENFVDDSGQVAPLERTLESAQLLQDAP